MTKTKNCSHFCSGVVGFENFHGNIDHFAAETISAAHHRAEVAFAQVILQFEIAVFQHEYAVGAYHVVDHLELLQ